MKTSKQYKILVMTMLMGGMSIGIPTLVFGAKTEAKRSAPSSSSKNGFDKIIKDLVNATPKKPLSEVARLYLGISTANATTAKEIDGEKYTSVVTALIVVLYHLDEWVVVQIMEQLRLDKAQMKSIVNSFYQLLWRFCMFFYGTSEHDPYIFSNIEYTHGIIIDIDKQIAASAPSSLLSYVTPNHFNGINLFTIPHDLYAFAIIIHRLLRQPQPSAMPADEPYNISLVKIWRDTFLRIMTHPQMSAVEKRHLVGVDQVFTEHIKHNHFHGVSLNNPERNYKTAQNMILWLVLPTPMNICRSKQLLFGPAIDVYLNGMVVCVHRDSDQELLLSATLEAIEEGQAKIKNTGETIEAAKKNGTYKDACKDELDKTMEECITEIQNVKVSLASLFVEITDIGGITEHKMCLNEVVLYPEDPQLRKKLCKTFPHIGKAMLPCFLHILDLSLLSSGIKHVHSVTTCCGDQKAILEDLRPTELYYSLYCKKKDLSDIIRGVDANAVQNIITLKLPVVPLASLIKAATEIKGKMPYLKILEVNGIVCSLSLSDKSDKEQHRPPFYGDEFIKLMGILKEISSLESLRICMIVVHGPEKQTCLTVKCVFQTTSGESTIKTATNKTLQIGDVVNGFKLEQINCNVSDNWNDPDILHLCIGPRKSLSIIKFLCRNVDYRDAKNTRYLFPDGLEDADIVVWEITYAIYSKNIFKDFFIPCANILCQAKFQPKQVNITIIPSSIKGYEIPDNIVKSIEAFEKGLQSSKLQHSTDVNIKSKSGRVIYVFTVGGKK